MNMSLGDTPRAAAPLISLSAIALHAATPWSSSASLEILTVFTFTRSKRTVTSTGFPRRPCSSRMASFVSQSIAFCIPRQRAAPSRRVNLSSPEPCGALVEGRPRVDAPVLRPVAPDSRGRTTLPLAVPHAVSRPFCASSSAICSASCACSTAEVSRTQVAARASSSSVRSGGCTGWRSRWARGTSRTPWRGRAAVVKAEWGYGVARGVRGSVRVDGARPWRRRRIGSGGVDKARFARSTAVVPARVVVPKPAAPPPSHHPASLPIRLKTRSRTRSGFIDAARCRGWQWVAASGTSHSTNCIH